MTRARCAPGAACAAVLAAGTDPRELNPVYRALADDTPATIPALGDTDLDLLRQQVTAPAVLAIAVLIDGRTRRMRIALRREGAGVEREDGESWSPHAPEDLPPLIAALFPSDSPWGAAPRVTQQSAGAGLGLDAQQASALRARIRDGEAPQEAVRRLPGLDPALRDALLGDGDRASASLTLHDAQSAEFDRPVTFGRLWTVGESGLYRTDTDAPPGGSVVPVEPGDVLGTVLALLEEGLRFAARDAGAVR